jgi:predicted alpha/beta-hydrolase family hydrolase
VAYGDKAQGGPAGEARLVEVEWRPGRRVTARLEGPAGTATPGVLLAPGAGAGRRHPFLTGLQRRLAEAGWPTMTFDYPYAAEGRRAPDRLEVLLECHRAAARRLRAEASGVVLAGKSMGGRVATHLAACGEPCFGVVCYGYPLLSPGKAVPRDTGHLGAVGVPLLFLSGSRDRLAPLDMLRPVVERLPGARLVVVEGADHSFGVDASRDARGEQGLDHLAAATVAWLAEWGQWAGGK